MNHPESAAEEPTPKRRQQSEDSERDRPGVRQRPERQPRTRGQARSLVLLGTLLIGTAMVLVGPGGWTGWILAAVLLIGLRVALTGRFAAKPNRYLATTLLFGLVLGAFVSSPGPVPQAELAARTPDVPKGWHQVKVTPSTSVAFKRRGGGAGSSDQPLARLALYRVPGTPKQAANTYIKSLRAAGWKPVDPNRVEELCLPDDRFTFELSCAVLTGAVINANWTDMERHGVVVTVYPSPEGTIEVMTVEDSPTRIARILLGVAASACLGDLDLPS